MKKYRISGKTTGQIAIQTVEAPCRELALVKFGRDGYPTEFDHVAVFPEHWTDEKILEFWDYLVC